MKRTAFLLFIFISFIAFSQELVEKSTQKVAIAGKTYLLHTVKEKQTLYSIARVYNVSQEVIEQENESIKLQGLKAGTLIRIPYSSNNMEIDTNQFFLFTAESKQTLYSISKQYNTTVDEIYRINPELEKGKLKVGQTIKIPKVIITPIVEKKEITAIHKVMPGETVYSISKRYNVTPDKIIALNEEVRVNGLKEGYNLIVPSHLNVLEPDVIDTLAIISNCDSFKSIMGTDIKIALLLPFYISKNQLESFTGTTLEEDEEGTTKTAKVTFDEYVYYRSSNALEFYEGVLIAIEDLKLQGLNLKLFVYDTEADSITLKNILAKPEMKTMDLIIGPAYNYNVNIAAEFARSFQIPLISPLTLNTDALNNNPYVFQINPSLNAKVESYFNKVKEFKGCNIIMAYDTHIADVEYLSLFKDELNKLKDSVSVYKMTIHELDENNNFKENLLKVLSKDTANIIIIPSEREAAVSQVISMANSYSTLFHISSIGLPKWMQFPNVDLDDYYNIELVSQSAFFFDYNQSNINEYAQKYRKLYKTDFYKTSAWGYNHSLLGYDVTKYFAMAVALYGKNIGSCVNHVPFKPLQSSYYFKSNQNSGYENIGIQYIQFNKDNTLKLLK